MIVHSADIGNQVLPWRMARTFAEKVAAEFVAQVKKEKELGLPVTAFMDVRGAKGGSGRTPPPNACACAFWTPLTPTTAAGLAKLNIGFIDFVVAPQWMAMAEIIPDLSARVAQLKLNRGIWQKIADTGVDVPAGNGGVQGDSGGQGRVVSAVALATLDDEEEEEESEGGRTHRGRSFADRSDGGGGRSSSPRAALVSPPGTPLRTGKEGEERGGEVARGDK